MNLEWYYNDLYIDDEKFAYEGSYSILIIAKNDWGYPITSNYLYIVVQDLKFPRISYLNIRSYEYRDVPEELFYVYLGTDEQITLFDFSDPEKIGLWNNIFGTVNTTFSQYSMNIETVNGGIKANFDHIQTGIGYYTQNLTLVLEIRAFNPNIIIIINTNSYDADYLLKINDTNLERFLEIRIPFYFFQEFGYDGIMHSIGFYSSNNTFNIYKIKIANFHNTEIIIDKNAYTNKTTNIANTSTILTDIYNFNNTDIYKSQKIWQNESLYTKNTYNYSCNIANNSTNIKQNDTLNSNSIYYNQSENIFYNTTNDFEQYTNNNCSINENNLTLKKINIAYDFTDDIIGEHPTGFYIYDPYNGIKILKDVNQHSMVLNIDQNDSGNNIYFRQDFQNGTQQIGKTTFWLNLQDWENLQWTSLELKSSSSDTHSRIQFHSNYDNSRFDWNGGNQIFHLELKTWYYFVWNWTENLVDLKIYYPNLSIFLKIENKIGWQNNVAKIKCISASNPACEISINALDYSFINGYYENRSMYHYDEKYYNYCIFESNSFKLNSKNIFYKSLNFSTQINSNTSVFMSYRDSTNNSTFYPWSEFLNVNKSLNIEGKQYIQFRIILNTTNFDQTPIFYYFNFSYFFENISHYLINYTLKLKTENINTTFLTDISINFTKNTTNNKIFIFNYSSSKFDITISYYNDTLEYLKYCFNGSTIIFLINETQFYNFSIEYNIIINITYYYFINTTFYNYLDLNISSLFYYYNFTIYNTSGIYFYWANSTNNSTFSPYYNILNINNYFSRYLKIKISLNTTDKFNNVKFFNLTFNYKLEKIIKYHLKINMYSNFTHIILPIILNFSIYFKCNFSSTTVENSSFFIYNYSSSNFENISSVENNTKIFNLNFNQNSTEFINISIEIFDNNPFLINISNLQTTINYYKFVRFISFEFDVNLENINEFSTWYKFDNENCTLDIYFYNEINDTYYLFDTLFIPEQKISMFGEKSTRYNQAFYNITNNSNFTKIIFVFTLLNPINFTHIENISIKRFELITYLKYRLESESNRQRYDILTFDHETETLLIVDVFGREIYRKLITYSEYIDIYIGIAEIILTNTVNRTIWIEFELSPHITVSYAVPSNASRVILLPVCDYFVKIRDNQKILEYRIISISNANQTTIKYSEQELIPILPPKYPWWYTGIPIFDFLIEGFVALFTIYMYPWGILVIIMLTIYFSYLIFKRYNKYQQKKIKKRKILKKKLKNERKKIYGY